MRNLRITKWNDLSPVPELREQTFLAYDPGKQGAGLMYRPDDLIGAPSGTWSLLGGDGEWELVGGVVRREVRLLIVEDQYVGKSAGVTQKLSIGVGAFCGAVAALCYPEIVQVVLTMPATWQAHQRKLTGGTAKRRKELADMAAGRGLEVFGEADWYVRLNKAQREGVNSALGVAEWWRGAF